MMQKAMTKFQDPQDIEDAVEISPAYEMPTAEPKAVVALPMAKKKKPGRKPGTPKAPGSGRVAGVPNKATLTAKQAIAEFVDGNAHRLTEWLDQVANGVPLLDGKGNPIMDKYGNRVYASMPNPEKAFNLFQSVIEYHVPKLARSEITGAGGGPLQVATLNLNGLSDEELKQMEALMSKAVDDKGTTP